MKKHSKTRPRRPHGIASRARLALACCALLVFVATWLIAPFAISSGSDVMQDNVSALPTPTATPLSNQPVHATATRISVIVGTVHELQIAAGVDSVIVVSPEIATGAVQNQFTVAITALKIGETILLARSGARRQTYMIEVVGKPRAARPVGSAGSEDVSLDSPVATGSSTTTYAKTSDSGTSLVRQSVDLRRKLSNGRTLRISGEMYKIYGGPKPDLAIARVQNVALNRMSLGIDTAEQTIDVLDSQVNISPMSLNGFAMRGFHLVRTPKQDPHPRFQKKGIEVYAGFARPSFTFLDTNGGKIAGTMIPVITTKNLQVRAGFTAVSADRSSRDGQGGVIAHADGIFTPTKEISLNAETSFSNGDLSWRTRIDVKTAAYGGSAEVTRFARSSPLTSIGAQSGGRASELFSFYWRPYRRISMSGGYNHTRVSRVVDSRSADFDRSLAFANVSLSINRNSRLNFRYSDQNIETAFRGGLTTFEIKTRTFSASHNIRFNQRLSNTFEARLNLNKEGASNEPLETGFSFREQLRLSWNGSTITGFLNYTNKTPSLTGLIVRNPQLLPPQMQTAFASDPAVFLRAHRDRLAYLLGGIELPLTRSFDAGARYQKAFSRVTVSAETRYGAGEIFAQDQKSVSTSAAVGVRLNSANSIRVTGSKSFGSNPHMGLTVSFTHQFGSSRKGFSFGRLFGLNRGKVRGRVFNDLNGNGKADAGEPGLAAMRIQVDGKRDLITDKDGRYEFKAYHGRHRVVLVSDQLGVRQLASTPTEQSVTLGRRKIELNFGVRDHGSISGRVVNDLGQSQNPQTAPGLGGVMITLRAAEAGTGRPVFEQVTAADGSYHFPNLRPGKYLIEIEPRSLPANYVIPSITASELVVAPLGRTYHDFSFAAQRAVTGIIFIDNDGDNLYTHGKDAPVEGAIVFFHGKEAATDVSGGYILRGLPAGRIEVYVSGPDRCMGTPFVIELGAEPVTKRSINIPLKLNTK